MKITKKITIDKFMELWDNAKTGRWDEVVKDYDSKLLKHWRDEIIQKFKMRKSENSYGPVGDGTLAMLSNEGFGDSPILPKSKPYTRKFGFGGTMQNPYYRMFPLTYVKTGVLEKDLNFPIISQFYQHSKDSKSLRVKVSIPFKHSEEDPYGYQELEEQRSFVKSSLILSWPKTMKELLQSIGE